MVRNRLQTYRCGGYSSYSGHCGGQDCETCHPGGAAEMRHQEALEEIEPQLTLLHKQLAEVQLSIQSEGHDIPEALLNQEAALLDENLTLEDGVDGECDFDDNFDDYEPDYDDYAADRAADAYERGIFG